MPLLHFPADDPDPAFRAAHAGEWHRQVSLLAEEDIDTMRGRGIELG